MKHKIISILSAFCALGLIFQAETVFQFTLDGIKLCLWTVIPSLFPLMMICSICCQYCVVGKLGIHGKLLGIPAGFESILIPAFLGGYPLGAQAVSRAYGQNKITKAQATHLLSFCNNAGPAFIFGIVSRQFDNSATCWLIWSIQIISSLLVAIVDPMEQRHCHPDGNRAASSIPHILRTSVRAMADICGWIIMFSVILGFLRPGFQLLPQGLTVAISGLLEMTSGCCQLQTIENEPLRFVLANVLLSFGGVCVLMQTASVCDGLPLKAYLKGKCKQTILSTLLSLAVVNPILLLPETILAGIMIKRKNSRFFANSCV